VIPASWAFFLWFGLIFLVIPSSVLGAAAGRLTCLVLRRQWSIKAAVKDAVLACLVTYVSLLVTAPLNRVLLDRGIGLIYYFLAENTVGVASVVVRHLLGWSRQITTPAISN
jgi:hypothetical protein